MTREKFMGRLIELLADIPEHERNDALVFYESYFEEAGPGDEENVIRKLGSPEKVAAQIKANLKESNEAYAEYSENGYEDSREPRRKEVPEVVNKHKTNSEILLAIIALIFLAPLLKGLFSGTVGVIITIIFLPFLVVFALSVAAIGLLISAVACIVAGIPMCFSSIAAGILTIGVGCILGAIGMASLAALIYMAVRGLPKIISLVANLAGKLLHKKEAGR